MNIYLELTRKFNQGRLRAVLAGGQAVVLHRLAMMSKDGDWILREEEETMSEEIGGQPLVAAHRMMTAYAEGLLPFAVSGGGP